MKRDSKERPMKEEKCEQVKKHVWHISIYNEDDEHLFDGMIEAPTEIEAIEIAKEKTDVDEAAGICSFGVWDEC